MIAFTRFDVVALIVIVILLALTGLDAGDASPRPPATGSRPLSPVQSPPECGPHPGAPARHS